MPSEPAGWLGLGALLGGAIGGAVAAAIKWMNARATIQRAARIDALNEWKEIATARQGQIDRQGAVIAEQQRAIEALWRSEAECRESLAEHRQALHFLYDLLGRMRQSLCELGHDPGPLPDLPPLRERQPPETEFAVRQAAQTATLAQEAARALPPDPKTGGT